jgi:teichuronic acid exporter
MTDTKDAAEPDQTDDLKQLDRALFSGIAWTALLRWSSQVISWTATVFVARLLVPGDYGLLAMAMIPIGLVRIAEDFGLDAILVQDRTIVGDRQAQLAGFVLGVGAVLTTLSMLLARPIAAFFKEPDVAQLIAVLSLLFLTDALQVVSRAILQRQLAFSKIAAVLFVQVAVTQGVLLTAALLGLGMWSLVLANVSGGVAAAGMLWASAPYRIRWPRHIHDLARPLLQGWRVMASRFAYYAYSTSDQTIIGRFLGKDALGAYSFTITFANLPFQEASSIITKVVPGVFSTVQNRRDELRRYFLMLTESLVLLTLPLSVGLALTADLVVSVILGPNWKAVVQPLQLMCIYSAFQGSQILISHLMMWTGQFRAQMWCSILTGVVLPLSFLALAGRGLVAIALAWSIVYPLTNVPSLLIGLRTVRVSFVEWLKASGPAAFGCLLMTVAVLAVRRASVDQPDVVRLAAAICVGGTVYAVVIWLAFRARIMAILDVVRNASKPQQRDAALPGAA